MSNQKREDEADRLARKYKSKALREFVTVDPNELGTDEPEFLSDLLPEDQQINPNPRPLTPEERAESSIWEHEVYARVDALPMKM